MNVSIALRWFGGGSIVDLLKLTWFILHSNRYINISIWTIESNDVVEFDIVFNWAKLDLYM